MIWNESTIPYFPNNSLCGSYGNGEDISWFAGLIGGYEIMPKFLFIEGRLSYDYRPASLSGESQCSEVLDPEKDEYVPFIREHNFDAQIAVFALALNAKLKPLSSLPLYFRAGIDIAEPFFSSEFTNTEKIKSPLSVRYENGTFQQTVGEGEIQSQTNLGLLAGAEWKVRLNENISLLPGVEYRYGLNSVMKESDWKNSLLRFTVSLAYNPGGKEKPDYEFEYKNRYDDMDEPAPVRDPIIALIKPEPVEIRETIVTRAYPILPYVFFDSASHDMKDIYLPGGDVDEFSENNLPNETLDIYYSIIDIIGSRMKENPEAVLTINGVTDGEELPEREDRLNLAGQRARNFAGLIANRWDIDRDRFIINKSDKPNLPTSTEYSEGFDENRRLELYSDNPRLLAPVIHSRFLEYTPLEKPLELKIDIKEPKHVRNYELRLRYNDEMVKKVSGEGAPETLTIPSDYQLEKIITDAAEKNKPLEAELTVYHQDGGMEISSELINITKNRDNFEIGRLNLIVFDFDRSLISDFNTKMINDFVRSAIKNNSKVNITGSTDRLGEYRYNMRLSLDRAINVRDYIKSINPDVEVDKVSGTGPDKLLYDNTLPEGRFYCRTVLIEVKTPIE